MNTHLEYAEKMMDVYDLAFARKLDAERERAHKLVCGVIVTAFEQERQARANEEQEETEKAAGLLMQIFLDGSRA